MKIILLKVTFKSMGMEAKMFYTVGEMAKKLGIAPSSLRYYDQEGLLPFVERSSGGMRMFKDSDYEWLQIIE